MFHVCSLVTLLAGVILLPSHLFLPSAFGSQQKPYYSRNLSSSQGTSLYYSCVSQTLLLPLVCNSGQEAATSSPSLGQNGDVLLAERWILQSNLSATACVLIFLQDEAHQKSLKRKELSTVYQS